eukprot:TRINITY_DN36102_c0_g1_i1.p1 TRINITY_DN36102_c0_g1~~TRINITY_DN36102_c0_g1_i1.p1  ORF type:complete len:305 (+),score=22.54 TRINITY_DN36102_c0_g1_i1:103-1017(+)
MLSAEIKDELRLMFPKNEYSLGTLAGNWQEDRKALEVKAKAKSTAAANSAANVPPPPPAASETVHSFAPPSSAAARAARQSAKVDDGLPAHLLFGHGADLHSVAFGTTTGQSFPAPGGCVPPPDRCAASRALKECSAHARALANAADATHTATMAASLAVAASPGGTYASLAASRVSRDAGDSTLPPLTAPDVPRAWVSRHVATSGVASASLSVPGVGVGGVGAGMPPADVPEPSAAAVRRVNRHKGEGAGRGALFGACDDSERFVSVSRQAQAAAGESSRTRPVFGRVPQYLEPEPGGQRMAR